MRDIYTYDESISDADTQSILGTNPTCCMHKNAISLSITVYKHPSSNNFLEKHLKFGLFSIQFSSDITCVSSYDVHSAWPYYSTQSILRYIFHNNSILTRIYQ